MFSFSGTRYIVEVKTREEDNARVQSRHESLRRGEVHGESQDLKRKNAISRIIDDGVEQLATVTDSNGATRLYDIDDTNYKVDGLHFRDSDLFRYRALLDGAAITMEIGDECQLFYLCNDHSPSYQAFRVSPLAQAEPGSRPRDPTRSAIRHAGREGGSARAQAEIEEVDHACGDLIGRQGLIAAIPVRNPVQRTRDRE